MTKMQLVHLVGAESSPTVAKLLGEIAIKWSHLEFYMQDHVGLLVESEGLLSGVITHGAGLQKWLDWSKELVALRSFDNDALADWKITYETIVAAQKARNKITHAFISSSKIRGFNRTRSLIMRGSIQQRVVEVHMGELTNDDLRKILENIHDAQVYLKSWQIAYVYPPIGGGSPRRPKLKLRKTVIK